MQARTRQLNSTPATVARLANMRLLAALHAAIRQVSFLLSGHWHPLSLYAVDLAQTHSPFSWIYTNLHEIPG